MDNKHYEKVFLSPALHELGYCWREAKGIFVSCKYGVKIWNFFLEEKNWHIKDLMSLKLNSYSIELSWLTFFSLSKIRKSIKHSENAHKALFRVETLDFSSFSSL